MRVACESCKNAYLVDDRALTLDGTRTQCPRCGHQQLTRAQAAVEFAAPKSPPPRVEGSVATPSGSKLNFRPAPPAGPAPRGVIVCKACGKELTDAFDQALGKCDDCRAKEQEQSHKIVVDSAIAPAPPPPRPVREVIAKPRPVAAVAAPSQPPAPAVMSAARGDVRPARTGLYVAIAAVAVIAAGAGAVAVFKPFDRTSKPAPPPPIPAAITAVLPKWTLSFPGLSGSAKEALDEAREAFALDTPAGYLDAEEAFQKAVILEPRSDEAVAGYVRSLGLAEGATVDEQTFIDALAVADAARQRSNEAPAVLVAEAELLAARPLPTEHLERARSLAEKATTTNDPAVRADAELVLGRAYAATSLDLALQHLDAAAERAPKLARVHLERAYAYEAAGDIRRAIDELGKRLESNPDHPLALAALSRVYQQVGDVGAARLVYERVLEKRPGDFYASLMLAVLRYQAENRAGEAVKLLRALARDTDRYEDRQKLDLFLHLAAAQRQASNLDGALEAVKSALALAPNDPAAHLQALLVAVERELPSEAMHHLPAVTGHLGDPALEKDIEARVLFGAGNFEEAAQAYQDAYARDSRRIDALIMSGVSLARAGKREQALSVLSPLADVDPTRAAPTTVGTRFFVAQQELLDDADNHIEKLARDRSDVTPLFLQGLIDWHRGAPESTERLLKQVLDVDATNVVAVAYLALVTGERKDLARARSLSERAVTLDKRRAIAHYALGVSLQAAGETERAARELTEAQTLSPYLLAAQLHLAQLDVAQRQFDSARQRLVRALGSDPSYLAAKRALYALEPPK